MSTPDISAEERACRVVVDGDEDETFLVCLTCDPGREVCCGHHLAPHDENGCHEQVVSRRGAAPAKCQCARRPNARVAAVVTAPSPAAAGLPAEDVERELRHEANRRYHTDPEFHALARQAACVGDPGTHGIPPSALSAACVALLLAERRLAAVALAEMRPTAAEEAVKRLIAVAPVMWHGDYPVKAVPVSDLISVLAGTACDPVARQPKAERTLRGALTPAPHDADGGEER